MALDFEATNSDYANLNLPASLKVANITLEAWIKMESFSSSSEIMAGLPRGAHGDARGFRVLITTDAKIQALKGDSDSSWKTATGTTTLSTGTWYHIAATFDGTTIRVFLNGVQDAATTSAVAINWTDAASGYPNPGQLYISGTKTNQIGGGNTVPDFFFVDGVIDEVRWWSVARTATQLLKDRWRRVAGNETSLVGYWRMDEGTGTTLIDFTQNGNSPTITGAVYADSAPISYGE